PVFLPQRRHLELRPLERLQRRLAVAQTEVISAARGHTVLRDSGLIKYETSIAEMPPPVTNCSVMSGPCTRNCMSPPTGGVGVGACPCESKNVNCCVNSKVLLGSIMAG